MMSRLSSGRGHRDAHLACPVRVLVGDTKTTTNCQWFVCRSHWLLCLGDCAAAVAGAGDVDGDDSGSDSGDLVRPVGYGREWPLEAETAGEGLLANWRCAAIAIEVDVDVDVDRCCCLGLILMISCFGRGILWAVATIVALKACWL